MAQSLQERKKKMKMDKKNPDGYTVTGPAVWFSGPVIFFRFTHAYRKHTVKPQKNRFSRFKNDITDEKFCGRS
jgi:hypothetical protein